MGRRIIDNHPELKISNLDQLPRGTGAAYLLVIDSPYAGEFVAKRWLRKMPQTTARSESIIRF